MYTSNLSQLEQARIEAARRVKFLVTVDAPSIADRAQYPERLLNLVVGTLLLFAAYFIIDIMVRIMRKHAG